jgi:hypothetical protein
MVGLGWLLDLITSQVRQRVQLNVSNKAIASDKRFRAEAVHRPRREKQASLKKPKAKECFADFAGRGAFAM